MKVDLTVLAIPAFVASMAAEYAWQKRNPAPDLRAGDYEFADTMASLSMGVGSLIAPYITDRLLAPLTPRTGRYAKAVMGLSLASAAVATAGDLIRRHHGSGLAEAGTLSSSFSSSSSRTGGEDGDHAELTAEAGAALPPALRRITGGSAVSAVASTVVMVSTLWSAQTASSVLFRRTPLDLGSGPLAYAVGILGWDFLYYWNHRLDHESRWLWAMHVVHHSSERYNLSTALRQPVAEALTIYVPYGLLSLLGVRPAIVQDARAVNLIYQFWVHTEAIRSIGPLEKVLNSPSRHRVHHGSNRRYLDRNHGSILIIWDRLFGTYEPEGEDVVYGLTTNIDTFNPLRIATHEWVAIARDVFRAQTWRDRAGYLVRGPGRGGRRAAARADSDESATDHPGGIVEHSPEQGVVAQFEPTQRRPEHQRHRLLGHQHHVGVPPQARTLGQAAEQGHDDPSVLLVGLRGESPQLLVAGRHQRQLEVADLRLRIGEDGIRVGREELGHGGGHVVGSVYGPVLLRLHQVRQVRQVQTQHRTNQLVLGGERVVDGPVGHPGLLRQGPSRERPRPVPRHHRHRGLGEFPAALFDRDLCSGRVSHGSPPTRRSPFARLVARTTGSPPALPSGGRPRRRDPPSAPPRPLRPLATPNAGRARPVSE